MGQERSDEDQDLLEVAALGDYLDKFWDSDLGQYLLKYALRDYNSALEIFKTTSPMDAAKIMECQGRMWRAESFRDWLSTGISEGARALGILEQRSE